MQAGYLLLRPKGNDPWRRFGFGYALLLLLLGTAVWEGHPGAATRVLLPLNLAFNALAPRTRAGLALLILGNLTVPAGLVQFTSLPNDGVGLGAASGRSRVLVQTRAGWSGVERDRRNFWSWSSGNADLAVIARPAPVRLNLAFRLRSVAPRNVTISQNGQVLWHGSLGPTWLPVTVSCSDGLLRFETDAPPVPEGTQPGARALAFCIDRVRVQEQ